MLKNLIRKSLNFLHLDLTQNLKYDRLTQAIIAKVVKPDSICIDVGCHKGEILDLILKSAPKGGHYGFEPIPAMYDSLVLQYSPKNHIFPYALSDKEGSTTFQFVRNAPAYSGINKRSYDIENPNIEELTVPLKKLDSLIPENEKISLIKIDVEGGELGVLKGAKNVLLRNKPIVIFECGLGASNYYGTKPEDVYCFLIDEIGLKISLLSSWLKNKPALTKDGFCAIYHANSDYYFIAHK